MGPQFTKVCKNKGIFNWNVEQFINWIKTLSFLDKDKERIVKILENECVDGLCFMHMTGKQWCDSLSLNLIHFSLLNKIKEGWIMNSLGIESKCNGLPPEVAGGVVCDLSNCSLDIALALKEADEQCQNTGKGLYYGQIVVLGYKEYRLDDHGDNWMPIGSTNDKFPLKRREIPNGIKELDYNDEDELINETHKITFTINSSINNINNDDNKIEEKDINVELLFTNDPTKGKYKNM
jgi:hypothetical protein